MDIRLTVDEEARKVLIDKGYDEKYGARPLRRTIQNMLEDKLAEEILDGKVKKGDLVQVSGKDGELVFIGTGAVVV